MSADDNDRFREGKLSPDPTVGTEPYVAGPAVVAHAKGGRKRPEILFDKDDLTRTGNLAIQALSARPDAEIFQRARELVRITRDPAEAASADGISASPTIERVPFPILREKLSFVASWGNIGSTGEVLGRQLPPKVLVEAVLVRQCYPNIPILRAVTETPSLLPDGTLLMTPGYDSGSGLYYAPPPNLAALSVHERPSRQDARDACNKLLELVSDFPFEAEHHRAAFLAGLLTPFAKFAYEGRTPMFTIDAASRGTGKTLLAELIGLVCFGRPLSPVAWTSDPDELRKQMTAFAQAGLLSVLFDNVSSELGGTALEAALTAPGAWMDRGLGTHKVVTAPILATFYATGNNIALRGDLARRVVPVRMVCPEENPSERANFKHAEIARHVREFRVLYIGCALTILRAYAVAERPKVEMIPMGGFERWAATVQAPLIWCGLADPGLGRADLRATADPEQEAAGQMIRGLAALMDGRAMTAKQILTEINANPARHESLLTSLETLVRPASGKPIDATSLGRRFGKHRDATFCGFRLRQASDGRTNQGIVWRIEATGEAQAPPGSGASPGTWSRTAPER